MGFDQYHEPPDELPPATRTFARLCASLTEEAEAIGWYEQRLAVERDPEAAAVMRDAHGRGVQALQHGPRVPAAADARCGARSPAGSCSSPGTSSNTARTPRRRPATATPRRLGAADGSLGIGGLRAVASMNHLLRSLAPISDAVWTMLDDEARQRLAPALAARKLVDFSGPHGWGHSATNLGRARAAALDAVRRRVRASSAGCCRWSRCAPSSSSRAPSCATPTAAPTTPTSGRSTAPRTRSRRPRTSPCSTAGRTR